jgi:hypothetical protein
MIGVLLVLIIVGVVLWLVETQIPMDPAFKTVIRVVAIIFLLLWLLQVFGLIHSGDPHVFGIGCP